jgi:hypothetical protein
MFPPHRLARLAAITTITLAALAPLAPGARATTITFSGNTSIAIGSIPGNTPFTGTFTYNPSATGVTTSYNGGTETLFSNAYTGLTLTIGGSTVHETVPGTIALFNNLTSSGGVSAGDDLLSFDPFGAGENPSSGTFTSYSLTPDFIYLSLVDSTGTAFSGTNLPAALNLAEFTSAVVGVDYGPLGSGNTDTISNLSTLKTLPDRTSTAWLLLGAVAALLAFATLSRAKQAPGFKI